MMRAEAPLQASPFADDFVDVAALNAHVSAHVVARVASVRSTAIAGQPIASAAVAVLGPAGGGKTHLFARLRHDAAAQATLILMRPYFGVSLSLRDVLSGTVDQLCLPVRGGEQTHLDVLSAHWLDGAGDDPQARHESAASKLVSLIPEIAPAAHLVRAVLKLRDRGRSERWEELAWLSGREPRTAADRADDGGASALSERDVVHMLRLLAILAAPVAPLVITFDQLENLAGDDESRVLGYGNLVSEMVDTLPCLTIVQLALTSEWMQFIEPRLSLPQKTRVAATTLLLEPPNAQERELLLRAWHERIAPQAGGRKKRFPYPLSADDLSVLLSAPGMTPRLLLAALSRVMAGKTLQEASSPRPGADPRASRSAGDGLGAWNAEQARVAREIDDKERSHLSFDGVELAEGLASALSFVTGLEVTTRTERDRIMTCVRAPGNELTVLYLTSIHHASVAATLAKAAELARTTKVVVVREKRFAFPPTWGSVQERRAAFERLPNARWLWLDRDETMRWLTLARLLSQARSQRLRRPPSDELLSADEVREEISCALAPHKWQSVVSVTQWLSDVPRDHGGPAASGGVQCVPVRPTGGSRDSATGGKQAFPQAPTLRSWLAQGRELGRAAASRYGETLRAIVRGQPRG